MASLKSCKISIPFLKKEAISLNHAYSILSEAFEKSRRAHSGNVFNKIYYKRNDRWNPLDILRKTFEGMEEARFFINEAERNQKESLQK